jgi:hypothetical protein
MLNRAITVPFHIFYSPINHHHANGYTLQPFDSIQDLHVAFPNFVLAIYFQIKYSGCGCKASTPGPAVAVRLALQDLNCMLQ